MNKKQFTFFWLDGKREVLPGASAAIALNSAGYGGGAIRALDFHAEGNEQGYEWVSDRRTWVKK